MPVGKFGVGQLLYAATLAQSYGRFAIRIYCRSFQLPKLPVPYHPTLASEFIALRIFLAPILSLSLLSRGDPLSYFSTPIIS
jgi:hypothetical protein